MDALNAITDDQGGVMSARYGDLLRDVSQDRDVEAFMTAAVDIILGESKFTASQMRKIRGATRMCFGVGMCCGMEMERK